MIARRIAGLFRYPFATAVACSALLILPVPAHADDVPISSDRRLSVRIVTIGAGDENGSGSQAVLLEDRRTGRKRQLLVSRWNEDPAANLSNLTQPLISPDDRGVYVSASDAAPTSGSVHRIDVKTGHVRFIAHGQALRIIRTGPRRGDLLVQVHRYHDGPEGGSYNPVLVISPDGRQRQVVPGSETDNGEEAIDPWLTKQGWRAW